MMRFSAEGLTFSFTGRDRVFQDLSFEPRLGEVTVLLGANGAGKTTLLQTLAGQLRPTEGVVQINGTSIHDLSQREIAQHLALMPQSELRQSGMTVRDMVRLGRLAHRGWWMPLTTDDEDKVDTALASTNTVDLADRVVKTLSGGQWRRAILARSLAQNASILLLDEPTSGLDLKHQYECLAQVRELVRSQNLIAVLSLHDLQQTAAFADRVALMSDGSLLAWGDCESVLTAERIREAYGVEVTVISHPSHGGPLVIPTGAGT